MRIMKRKLNKCGDSKERLWLKAIDALDATFPLDLPLSTAARATEEAAVRKRKAEQANEDLWAFGGKVRDAQQEWRRLQGEMKHSKRHKSVVESTTYRGPLLMLNQYYWENQLGANISRIKGDNMFGINMFGSYNEMMQRYLSGRGIEPVGCDGDVASQGLDRNHKDYSNSTSSQQDVLTPRAAVPAGAAANKSLPCFEEEIDSTSSNSHSSPIHCPEPATKPVYHRYDLAEIEEVCRQQHWSHLPASKRFIKGRRFLKATRQLNA